ncbi:hypothetical protein LJB76_02445 [Clostridia bacterium OttesenSCG-928-O13]|nr:hypothetical protein [Clostridia bacterium OttesenSCG-928-O13]
MTKTYCDRCEKQLEGMRRVVPAHVHIENKWYKDYDENFDLCESCADGLKKWLQPLPKEAHNEQE